MSVPQGNNIVNNQLNINHDTVTNRRIADNFSSSRSYAPECKLNLLMFSFAEKKD